MFEQLLAEQNKHWHGQKPEAGFERECLNDLMSYAATKHIIALLGVRRCGK